MKYIATIGAYVCLGIAMYGAFTDALPWRQTLIAFAGAILCYLLAVKEGALSRPQKSDAELEAEQAEREEREAQLEAYRQAKADKANPTVCPKCGSRNSEVLGSTNRVSLGRAVVGNAIAGVPGAMVGAMTGKKQRHEFICRDCGHRWIVK